MTSYFHCLEYHLASPQVAEGHWLSTHQRHMQSRYLSQCSESPVSKLQGHRAEHPRWQAGHSREALCGRHVDPLPCIILTPHTWHFPLFSPRCAVLGDASAICRWFSAEKALSGVLGPLLVSFKSVLIFGTKPKLVFGAYIWNSIPSKRFTSSFIQRDQEFRKNTKLMDF